MNTGNVIRTLLIEDDEDDFILTRDLLTGIHGRRFELEWVRTFDAGLEAMTANRHDVCLVDYRLGARNGIELLTAAIQQGCEAPIILLTGLGEHKVDLDAMHAGAADYLVKGRLKPIELERSIRYAVERKRAALQAASEQARLAAFGADVGLALTGCATLDAILENCARAMTQYLNAALAQVWVYDEKLRRLSPRAAAGPAAGGLKGEDNLPVMALDVDKLAKGEPVLIKDLSTNRGLADAAWAKGQGVVSFAAYPLLLENRLVGMMSLFSTAALTESTLQELASVAHGVALCIERKQSELALDASEVKYRSVVESIREVVFQMNVAGHWTFLNPAWLSATGFTVAETQGTFFADYVCQDDRPHIRQVFLELMERKLDHSRFETRLLTKDGRVLWMEAYFQRTQNPDGTVLGVSGSLNDITERKEAEGQIQKLAAFPRVNPNPVLEFAADGTISYSNDAARQLAQSLGHDDMLQVLPAKAGEIARESLATGGNRLRHEVIVTGHTLSWSFFPIVASSVVHCYGTDITDVVSLEAQFRHAQKLESVGQLAAGVAHDFNNILTVIQGYSDLLLGRCLGDATMQEPLKHIADASRRASVLTRQLLTFSRKQVLQLHVISLNSVLGNLGTILSRLLGEDVSLKTDLTADAASIQADSGMIEQVVMNLAVNARDAMPKGGELHVTTSVLDVSLEHARRQVAARPGRFVCLEVTDTGSGMEPETLGRIFEPFFSTKEVGKGTGLGLATVYGIVKQHQGWIEVVSEVGTGTTFKIFLPAIAQPAEATSDTAFLRRDVSGGQETILVVEDEPDLREMVREILSTYRYTVIAAANGPEALKIWDQYNGDIDLLLTDILMPEGLTGRDLAAKLRQRKPELKVIFTSGYSPAIAFDDPSRSDGLFLQKPYRPPALAHLVRQCLDTTAS